VVEVCGEGGEFRDDTDQTRMLLGILDLSKEAQYHRYWYIEEENKQLIKYLCENCIHV
jgi:hypothetical protein